MKKKILITLVILFSFNSLFAAEPVYSYVPIESIYIDASQWMNINIPYYLPSADTTYSWELTFSSLTSLNNRCGSLVGVYNGNRSGYFYSNSNHGSSTKEEPNFRVCVGDHDRDTWYKIGGRTEKNTISAKYTHSGSSGTYTISDTLGIIGNNVTGTWTGQYAWGSSNQFSLVACARYNYGNDGNESAYEFCSFYFYNVKIYEEINGVMQLKIDLQPVIRINNSTGEKKVCVRNSVDGNFIEFAGYVKSLPDIVVASINTDGGTLGNNANNTLLALKNVKMNDIPTEELPTKEGYNFLGYYSGRNATGTRYYDHDGKCIQISNNTSDFTLYAAWHKNHEDMDINVWENNNSLPNNSGNYVLVTDITLSNSSVIPSNTFICLNGHTINGTVVISNDNIEICSRDDEGTGTIGTIQVSAGKSFNVEGKVNANVKLGNNSFINIIGDITGSNMYVTECTVGTITNGLKAYGGNPMLGQNIWVKLPDSTYGVIKTKSGELKVMKR